jgi:hypothetical protein
MSHITIIRGRRKLRKLLKGMSTVERLLFARKWAAGQVQYVPTPREACEQASVADSYLRTFERLDPGQRAAVELGVASLSTFHNAPRHRMAAE